MTARRLGLFAGLPLIGLAVGIAVAIASSPSSLSPDRHGETGTYVQPSPSALPTPTPTVTTPGVLGTSGRLLTNGSNTVIAIAPNVAIGSADGGRTWVVVRPPANGSGLAIDPTNPRHAIAGGSAVQVSGDGGLTWVATASAPPGKAPYQPLAISPMESNVWFLLHQNHLLLTRDAGSTWSELSSLQVANPIFVPGQALGQFFVATANRVFQLSGYGQRITELPAVSGGDVSNLVAVGGNHPGLLASVAGRGVFLFSGITWTASPTRLTGPVATGAGGLARGSGARTGGCGDTSGRSSISSGDSGV